MKSRVIVLALLLIMITGRLTGQSPAARSVAFGELWPSSHADYVTWSSVPTGRVREPRSSATVREVGLLIGILGVALASTAVEEPRPLDCGPCDRRDVPGFERWAVSRRHDEWDVLSTATLLGGTGIGWVDQFKRTDGQGFSRFGASLESAVLTLAATNLLKRASQRLRPYSYAEFADSLDGRSFDDARASWPSGHTSLAFALATSYWMSRGHHASPTVKRIVGVTTVLTGVLRVAAGRHFPTDVVSGAALGIGGALLVHSVRF